jgi:hypothetical protein
LGFVAIYKATTVEINITRERAMAIYINDQETEAFVRALSRARSETLTSAINFAAREALAKAGLPMPEPPQAKSRLKGDAALKQQLDARIRSDTLKYTRLRNRVLGTKGGGSRVYQMLGNHGAVEALRRLVMRPTEGLEFLVENDALEISAEMVALDPKFTTIIPEHIRIRARANLAIIERSQ